MEYFIVSVIWKTELKQIISVSTLLRCPSRCSFSLNPQIIIPFGRSNPPPGRQRDAQGNFCSQGDNRVRDRHPTIWVNRLLGNGSVSSSYALSPTNYVIRNAGSHRRFFFLPRRRYAYTCTLSLRAPTSLDTPVASILKFL